MHPDLTQALAAGHGVVSRRDATLLPLVSRAVRRGELVAVLPGVYARPANAAKLAVRARAACVADPEAVVTGRAAGILGGWTHLAPPAIVHVASQGLRTPRAGFVFERRQVDRTLTRVVGGVRITTFPLTALDLAVELGEDQLDEALRRGVEPIDLQRALELSRGRRAFWALRRPVGQLRDRAWSPLERTAHDLLRGAGIEGWMANRGIVDRDEELLGYGDLIFARLGLVVELDGAAHHTDAAGRARDAARDLRLARNGWEVVRLPGRLVTGEPKEFVAIVRDLVRTREGRRSASKPGH